MLAGKGNISKWVILMLLVNLSLSVYAFSDTPKGSRLNIKSNGSGKNKLTFKKGKSVLPFEKPRPAKLEIQPSKTANLYFSNLLINRNQSNGLSKESAVAASNTVALQADNRPTEGRKSSGENIDPGERLYYSENLQITNVYPNPADDYAFFKYNYSGGYNSVKITFLNVLGSPTNASVQLDRNENMARIYVKELNSGIYFYQLIADGKTLATKKLLVRHFN